MQLKITLSEEQNETLKKLSENQKKTEEQVLEGMLTSQLDRLEKTTNIVNFKPKRG